VHSSRFALDLPDDFPIRLLEAVHGVISDADDARRQTSEWSEWAGACNGVLYRFLACAEHADLLDTSLASSTSPPQPERYEQEKLLYEFFAEGLSALECLYYGVYFIGVLADSRLDASVDRRLVNPRFVTECFESTFPVDAITTCLREVLADAEYERWRDTRNVLSHRAAPGRDFRIGGDDAGTYWMEGTLGTNTIVSRRTWLASTIEKLLTAFRRFVDERLSG